MNVKIIITVSGKDNEVKAFQKHIHNRVLDADQQLDLDCVGYCAEVIK